MEFFPKVSAMFVCFFDLFHPISTHLKFDSLINLEFRFLPWRNGCEQKDKRPQVNTLDVAQSNSPWTYVTERVRRLSEIR